MELTCPKCHGPMRTYERNGVHVDQCADCRGIFLDRGELERLIDAENAWHDKGAVSSSPSSSPSSSSSAGSAAAAGGLGAVVSEVLGQARGHKQGYRYDDDHDRRYDDRRYDEYGRPYGQGYGHPKRKKSFLSELFD
jgi:Zn-finger nucleic acid-binding protein